MTDAGACEGGRGVSTCFQTIGRLYLIPRPRASTCNLDDSDSSMSDLRRDTPQRTKMQRPVPSCRCQTPRVWHRAPSSIHIYDVRSRLIQLAAKKMDGAPQPPTPPAVARDVRAMPMKLITVSKGNSQGAEAFAQEWVERIER